MLLTEKVEANKDNLVTKSNMLIEANYKLGVVEQKIILCLASNIHPADSDFTTYTLPIKEFTHLLGLKGTPKYTELRRITKELMQKVFEVRISRKVIQVSWLSYVAYNETEGTIDIRFDPFLRPYLLELKREFTSYKLENVVKLKSSYAIRLYELLKQYERLQERMFYLCELRKMLGAEDIYPAYGNFKQRVLVPAQKELEKKTDISFQIEEIKAGRKVEKVKFIIQSVKKNKSEQLTLFEENLEEFKFSSTFAARVKKLGLRMGTSISDKTIKNWEKFGQDYVLLLMEKIQERTDIENPVAYITAVLNASPMEADSQSAASEESVPLLHLIKYFRRTKELMPNWFIEDKAIEELQSHFNMELEEAKIRFGEIQAELFKVLGVIDRNPKNDVGKNKKRSVKEIVEQLQKHN
ncbi:replication initiation protein [Bacillus sp. ISL-47]|uniref:replication initiation protein n=1 Tax=Bacillus sp. ISL-47 TaxID=2819130 RepID=UPI001BE9962E|nr:replication initiation protein [Bacillus sp. ISL-47]MBT2687781.1 replication initiation protein [Bacillus sp. ISL-47]MBT2709123.1 replication initiation protein [Pseudomonas sp. ISL-84]